LAALYEGCILIPESRSNSANAQVPTGKPNLRNIVYFTSHPSNTGNCKCSTGSKASTVTANMANTQALRIKAMTSAHP
jgi:hypothetical protein